MVIRSRRAAIITMAMLFASLLASPDTQADTPMFTSDTSDAATARFRSELGYQDASVALSDAPLDRASTATWGLALNYLKSADLANRIALQDQSLGHALHDVGMLIPVRDEAFRAGDGMAQSAD